MIIIIIICILIFWLIVTHKYRCKTAELLLSEVQSFLRKLQDPQKLNVISFVYLVGPTMNVSWTFFSDWCDTNEQIVRNSRRLQALGSLHSGPFFVQHSKHNGFHNLFIISHCMLSRTNSTCFKSSLKPFTTNIGRNNQPRTLLVHCLWLLQCIISELQVPLLLNDQ